MQFRSFGSTAEMVRECTHATRLANVDSEDCIPACKWLVPIAPGRAGEVEGDLVADGHAPCIECTDNISIEDAGA